MFKKKKKRKQRRHNYIRFSLHLNAGEDKERASLLTHLVDEEYANSFDSVSPPYSPTAFIISLLNLSEQFKSVPKCCVTTHLDLKHLHEWLSTTCKTTSVAYTGAEALREAAVSVC